MNEEKTIIEINGIKLEVDLRTAKRVDTFKVGSKVKLLDTSGYGAEAKIYPGVVVGFEPFDQLPTIIVAYIEAGYNSAEVKFAYLNSKTEKKEIIMSIDDELPVDKADVLEAFSRKILSLQNEIEELQRKEAYFLRNFNCYFSDEKEIA